MDPVDTVQELTVSARSIRAGDVFIRHGRTWTARHDAYRIHQFTATVETDGGGVVYIPVDEEVVVRRDMKGLLASLHEKR
ncbi:hypothetical protein [Streptomyces zaomyceticus]|uniref:hypothetical protein n=1 Tax=Streptomyces zaomyceticus TaxID=68286 RepID=UPI0034421BA4